MLRFHKCINSKCRKRNTGCVDVDTNVSGEVQVKPFKKPSHWIYIIGRESYVFEICKESAGEHAKNMSTLL